MINFLSNDIFGLNGYSCADSDVFPLFEAAKFMIVFVQIAVPFGLVLWGSIDWFKALIAHDEKEMRMKRKPFLARVIAAIIVIVLPWLMTFISKVVAGSSNTANFWTCYHEAKPQINFKKIQERTRNGSGGNILNNNGNNSTNTSTKPTETRLKCSDYTTEDSCNAGKSTTHTCVWKERQTSYNSTSGSCENKEKITEYECSQYSVNSCPKVDKNGDPCVLGRKEGSTSTTCIKNPDPKRCEDYTTAAKCNAGDDYGNECSWYLVKTQEQTGRSVPIESDFACKTK